MTEFHIKQINCPEKIPNCKTGLLKLKSTSYGPLASYWKESGDFVTRNMGIVERVKRKLKKQRKDAKEVRRRDKRKNFFFFNLLI